MPIRSVDGVIRSPQQIETNIPSGSIQVHPRIFAAPIVRQPKKRWWKKMFFPLCVIICMCAGFLLSSLTFGVVAVGVYAVVAWIRRIPSKASFLIAFLSLLTVIALLVIRQNVVLANNFSTYTFLLFIVGVVSLSLESRANPRRKRSKIRR